MQRVLACAFLLATLFHGTPASFTRRWWNPLTYPNPGTIQGSLQCGHNGDRAFVCDPDNLLSDLFTLEEGVRTLELTSERPCGSGGPITGTQFVIALMKKMESGITAEDFATFLHDDWGVGHVPVHTRALD